jgi:hypothetical protein
MPAKSYDSGKSPIMPANYVTDLLGDTRRVLLFKLNSILGNRI